MTEIEIIEKRTANCPFCGSAKTTIMSVWRGPSLEEGVDEYFPYCERCGAFIQVMPPIMSFPSGFKTYEQAQAFFNCRSEKREDEDELGNITSEQDPCDICEHDDICDWWNACLDTDSCAACAQIVRDLVNSDINDFCGGSCANQRRRKANENL